MVNHDILCASCGEAIAMEGDSICASCNKRMQQKMEPFPDSHEVNQVVESPVEAVALGSVELCTN